MPEFSAREKPDYFQLRDAHGGSIERSRSLRGADLPWERGGEGASVADLPLPDGRRGRLLQLDFALHPGDRVPGAEAHGEAAGTAGGAIRASVVVAHDREEFDRVLRTLRLLLAAATAVVLGLVFVLARTIARIGLQPLTEVEAQVSAIDVGDLSRRLQPARGYQETDAIDRILDNLIANAIAYGPPGSSVRCVLESDAETFALRIANPAMDLEPDDVSRLLDPLWRKDPARGGEHLGLGLNLVRAYVEQLGIALELSLDAERVFHAVVRGARVRRSR